MRILICTQAIDQTDPVLGFFHSWVEAFSGIAESAEVVCLRKGTYGLPQNVFVHSLRKEGEKQKSNRVGRMFRRVRYAVGFLRQVHALRGRYDMVFVHMNQEYVLLAGWYWKVRRVPVYLWRNHRQGSVLTKIASALSNSVFYTSPSAYVANRENAYLMPIGIDTELYQPNEISLRKGVLLLGRLDAIKRIDWVFKAIARLAAEGTEVRLEVYGAPSEGQEAHFARIRNEYKELEGAGVITYRGAIAHADTASVYGRYSIYVNVTPNGSFDKTIGEAMASGCLVVCTNEAVKEVIPPELFVTGNSVSELTESIRAALRLPEDTATKLRRSLRTYIEENHSLRLLMEKLQNHFERDLVCESDRSENTAVRRIPVCILMNNLWIGGTERLVVDQLRHWDRTQYDVHLITLLPHGTQHENLLSLVPDWIRVHHLSFRSIMDLGQWRKIFRILKVIRPRTLISHHYFSNVVARILSFTGRYAVISFEHNTYVDRPIRQRLLNRLLATKTDRIVAVSESVRTYLVSNEGVDADRIVVIPNGITLSAFTRDDELRSETRKALGIVDELLVLSIGRITPQKGYEDLLRTAALLGSVRKTDIVFRIAGGSDKDARAMQARAETIGVHDRVKFLGERTDIRALLSAADVFFMPSKWEGFGIALIEAMSAGLPTVVRAIEPLASLAEGSGYSGAGPEEFAQSLTILQDHPDERRACGNAGRLIANKYTIEHNVSMLLTLEAEVARERGIYI